MPVQVSYPGVYIEEIPSGVRTLTGVATSITAFLGNARRGPVNWPVTIFSYADFERTFGGLWVESDMSYAVRDFFLNGGSQAVIVRVAGATAAVATASTPLPSANTTTMTLVASSPGQWGNKLTFTMDLAVDPSLPAGKFFNLTIKEVSDNGSVAEEKFRNVVLDPLYTKHARYLPAVLENESKLVSLDIVIGGTPPEEPTVDLSGSLPADVAFANGQDGDAPIETELEGSPGNKTGLYALENADLFNLLCIPNVLDLAASPTAGLPAAAAAYCEKRRAMFLIDAHSSWKTVEAAETGGVDVAGGTNAAIYFPRLLQPDPLRDGQLVDRPPCGAVAGVIARTDATRGIWKAPAGLDATLNGVPKLTVPMTDEQNGLLNPKGINCLRTRPAAGRVIWGARTRKGDDQLSSEWKYIPVRRLALYIEESLYRGTQWVVFEPNDEPLWAQIRLNVGAFMNNLFRQGAFQGAAPAEAYFVKCDKETTTQSDINLGIVNIVVGFAPLKPAEFVIIKLQQIAGEVAA